MRREFEEWAQHEGLIVRRREDKPDQYLVMETQRRWLVWQAALASAGTSESPRKVRAQKPENTVQPHEAVVRNRVLNEVLDAFSNLDDGDGLDAAMKVLRDMKKERSQT